MDILAVATLDKIFNVNSLNTIGKPDKIIIAENALIGKSKKTKAETDRQI